MLRALLYSLSITLFFISSMGSMLFFIFFYFGQNLPEHDFLKNFIPIQNSRVYSRDGLLLREWGKEKRTFVAFDDIPEKLILAFLCAEDRHFLEHPGIDVFGLFRAMILNTVKGQWGHRPSGASTITQQVAKNFLTGSERSLSRKIKEAILSMRLEKNLSKQRILELYLNQIFLGQGSYGIVAAARTYFKKELDELSISEMAFLASLPKAPSNYNPYRNNKILPRCQWVLRGLFEEGFITKNEFDKAIGEKIQVSQNEESTLDDNYFLEALRFDLARVVKLDDFYTKGYTLISTLDPKLQETTQETLREFLESYDFTNTYWRGVLGNIGKIQENWLTDLYQFSLKIKKMPWARIALVLNVERDRVKIAFLDGSTHFISLENFLWRSSFITEKKNDIFKRVNKISDVFKTGDVFWMHAKTNLVYQVPDITGGIVIMEAQTGEVLSVAGGYSFLVNQFNTVTQAKRQAGSAFKTFVYLSALEKGYGPTSLILDAPLQIALGAGMGFYAPKNITGRSYGETSLLTGFSQSRNQMTVRLAMAIGMRSIAEISKRLGVVDNLPLQLAMSLGACETTLLRLTTAYLPIVNGGYRVGPRFIRGCYDVSGNELTSLNPTIGFSLQDKAIFQNWHYLMESDMPTPYDNRERVIREDTSRLMQSFLKKVVDGGTARSLLPLAQTLNIDMGGKTGTTNDNKDVWFIGYVRYGQKVYAIGCFLGYQIPRSLGDTATGGTLAVPLFRNLIEKIHPILEKRED